MFIASIPGSSSYKPVVAWACEHISFRLLVRNSSTASMFLTCAKNNSIDFAVFMTNPIPWFTLRRCWQSYGPVRKRVNSSDRDRPAPADSAASTSTHAHPWLVSYRSIDFALLLFLRPLAGAHWMNMTWMRAFTTKKFKNATIEVRIRSGQLCAIAHIRSPRRLKPVRQHWRAELISFFF